MKMVLGRFANNLHKYYTKKTYESNMIAWRLSYILFARFVNF